MERSIVSHAGLVGYYEGYLEGILSRLKRKEEPTADDKFMIELIESALANGQKIWDDIRNKK